jgi:3-methyladenine DNA glycosylase Tag
VVQLDGTVVGKKAAVGIFVVDEDLFMHSAANKRCSWVNAYDPLLLDYHDREWGVPAHSDRKHFEVLVLSGAEAGLNWSLVLKKREGYRRAFNNFDPEKVARYCERTIQTLVSNPEIIRNRMKIEAAVRKHGHFSKSRKSSGTLTPTVGIPSADSPSSTAGKLRDRFQRLRRNPRHSARISSAGDLVSSARRSLMRTCRRSEW